MIGYFFDGEDSQRYPLPFMKYRFPRTGCYIAMVGSPRSWRFTQEIAEGFRKNTDLPAVTLNAPAIVVGIGFSDYWSFASSASRP